MKKTLTVSLALLGTSLVLFSCASTKKVDSESVKPIEESSDKKNENNQNDDSHLEKVSKNDLFFEPETAECESKQENNGKTEFEVQTAGATEISYKELLQEEMTQKSQVAKSEIGTIEEPTETADKETSQKSDVEETSENSEESTSLSESNDDSDKVQKRIVQKRPAENILEKKEKETQTVNNSESDKKKDTETAIIDSLTRESEDVKTETQASGQNKSEQSESGEDTFEEKITPSRSITLKNNLQFDVEYPGSGWVYLGESEQQKMFSFNGRKTKDDITTFSMRTRKSGSSILHFYKNDSLTGKYIDDYLEISVTDEVATDSERVIVPSYEKLVPSKPVREPRQAVEYIAENTENLAPLKSNPASQKEVAKSEIKNETASKKDTGTKKTSVPKKIATSTAKKSATSVTETKAETEKTAEKSDASSIKQSEKDSGSGQLESLVKDTNVTEIETDEVTESIAAESLLENANKALSEKKYEEAMNYAKNYLAGCSKNLDEAYYILGQIYEANSKLRNIKSSVNYYSKVVDNYPLSKFWAPSNNRLVYLRRFYIDIR